MVRGAGQVAVKPARLVCVLTTALDAVALDFQATILEDAAAAHKREVHEHCLALYRRSAIWPLLRVETADQFLADATGARPGRGPEDGP